MYSKKTLLTAAAVAVLSAAGAGSAYAAPWDRHHSDPATRHEEMRHDEMRHDMTRHDVMRHDMHRHIVMRERVFETLRFHRFRGVGDPYFSHGRYVVRSFDRFGHVVLVEIDPYTGAFIGATRI